MNWDQVETDSLYVHTVRGIFFSSFKDGFHVPGKDVDDDGVAEGADDPEDEEEEAERMLNKRKTIYFS